MDVINLKTNPVCSAVLIPPIRYTACSPVTNYLNPVSPWVLYSVDRLFHYENIPMQYTEILKVVK